MKYALLFILLIPTLCFAQDNYHVYKQGRKMRVYNGDTLVGNVHQKSHQLNMGKFNFNLSAGYLMANDRGQALPTTSGYAYLNDGLLCKFNMLYNIVPCLAIGAYAERDMWKVKNTQIGITANVRFSHFYLGVDAGKVITENTHSDTYEISYKKSLAGALHSGFIQKLNHHIFINEELAYRYFSYKYNIHYSTITIPDRSGDLNVAAFYLTAGISYVF